MRQPRSVGGATIRLITSAFCGRLGLRIFVNIPGVPALTKREQEGQFGKKTKLSQENQELSALFAKQPGLRKKTRSSAYILYMKPCLEVQDMGSKLKTAVSSKKTKKTNTD